MAVTRRTFLESAAASLALGHTSRADAQGPSRSAQQGRQVAGIYRRRVGAIEVSALLDGYLDLDFTLLSNADPADAARVLERHFEPKAPYRASVNAYVINTGERILLIDTGGAKWFAPTLGWLLENLRAAGVDPLTLDAVLLTHIHPDHSNGLIDGEGRPTFPNAELHVSTAEYTSGPMRLAHRARQLT
jgi:glyoxylase-like metal-dependent hydrolase (beta-lactamase superfamily II)